MKDAKSAGQLQRVSPAVVGYPKSFNLPPKNSNK
jgi:hypothetical protein